MGLVVLLHGSSDELTLGPAALASLAAFGVTSAALVRDADTVGLVLEGWAFDPRQAHEAAAAVGVGSAATLRTLVQMAVTATTEGAHNEEEPHTAAGRGIAARAR